MNNRFNWLMVFLVLAMGISSCKKSDQPIPPRILHLEIGAGNSGSVQVGSDLHFEADIEAGDRLDVIEIVVRPQTNGIHSQWSYEMVMEAHRGARNAHIHEHVGIPTAAAPGAYDFVVVAFDQNGTRVEVRRTLMILVDSGLN